MLDAREIKNVDEITLLNQAAAMVDGVYHMIWEELKPGVRENDIVAKANKMLYEMGSDDVEAINAISGERCNPASAQLHRPHHSPGRPGLLRHPAVLHGLPHLLLPHLQRRPRHRRAARRLQALPRMARQGHRSSSSRASRPTRSRPSGPRRRSSASPTRWRPSACSSATAWGSRCTSGRSSRGSSRWISRWS